MEENIIGKICPFCKEEITETDAVKVCPECGIPHHEKCWIENNGCTTFGCSGKEKSGDVCANCGAPLGEGQMFCIKCGTPKNAPKKEVCKNCGSELQEGMAFCTKCGTAKDAPKKNVCGKCGNEMAEGQEFCQKCGQKAGLVVDAGVNNAINQFNANVQKQNKKKSVLPIIIGAAGVVFVAIVIVLVLLLKGPKVEQIQLSESSVDLKVGDSVSVTYVINPAKASDADVEWSSSNSSVATVNNGRITGQGDGTCIITATAGGKSDTITVTVKSGPDLIAIYNEYCDSTWAEYGYDGSYIFIDTNPYDWDDDGLAYPDAYYALTYIHEALGLPSSLLNDMGETSASDGKQTEVYDEVTVSWKYHPDRGLEVTYKLND